MGQYGSTKETPQEEFWRQAAEGLERFLNKYLEDAKKRKDKEKEIDALVELGTCGKLK